MERRSAVRPRARQAGLVVQDLPDEVLVYDLERHKAHCLSPRSAAVWRACDGRRTPAQIARRLGEEMTEEVVWVALQRLGKARLLDATVTLPAAGTLRSRREWLRDAAVLGGLAVASISVPTAAYAVSCVDGAACCGTRQVRGTCPETRACCVSGLACVKAANGPNCSCGGAGCT